MQTLSDHVYFIQVALEAGSDSPFQAFTEGVIVNLNKNNLHDHADAVSIQVLSLHQEGHCNDIL